jgi:hypothetical protein
MALRRLLVATLVALLSCAGPPARQSYGDPDGHLDGPPDGDRSDASTGEPALYTPAPGYTGSERTSRYLTMRDGVRIAIDVSVPRGLASGERVPALLLQTRYWRSKSLTPLARLFVAPDAFDGRIGEFRREAIQHGYAWIDVDTRGSGASFGSRPWDFSPDEVADGAQIADWIVSQPWSNGRIGAVGASYSGSTAEFLLVNRHPAVRAVAPLLCEADQYTDILAPGGIPQVWYFEDWARITAALDRNELPLGPSAKLVIRGVRPVDDDPEGALLEQAIREHAANYDFRSLARVVYRDDLPFSRDDAMPPERALAMGRSFAMLERRFGPDFLARGVDLASAHAWADELAATDAAVYSYSGWYDAGYTAAAARRYRARPRRGNKLIIGPWDHSLRRVSPVAGTGPSHFDHAGELLKFFDYHLKDVDTGIDDEPPVHYFTFGDERWKTADAWPPPATQRSYYFARAGRLDETAPASLDAADAHRVDPTVGSGHETRWDTLTGRALPHPYPDRTTRDEKLLTYTGAPLERAMEVTGHPVVTLWVDSTATDGAFFAYLEDVAPGGHVTYVSEGMLRALHRKGDPATRTFLRRDAEPLVPGEPAQLVFELLPTSYVFAPGHAIRLAIAGADHDHFAQIPVDGAPLLHVHRSRDRASRIELPVVARQATSGS